MSFKLIDKEKIQPMQIHFGSWFDSPGQVRDSRAGEVTGFELNPYVNLGLPYKIKEQLLFTPEVGYIFERNEDHIAKNQFWLRFDFSYLVSENFKFSVGSSFMTLRLNSDGSEKVLRNGNSTETYFRPSEASTAFNQTLDFGIEYNITQKWGVKLQSFIYSWPLNEKRTTSFTLGLIYNFSLKEYL